MLPSDTIQNPKNDGTYMYITTRSGRMLSEPHSVVHIQVDDFVLVDEVNETTPAEFEKLESWGRRIQK